MKRSLTLSQLFGAIGLLGLLIPNALGQGSAQGYGQGRAGSASPPAEVIGGGMGGGGMGGGMMGGGGFFDARQQVPKRVESGDRSLWQERVAILTPGDRVEFKFKLEAGRTLLCGVETDSFDAALSIVDEKGTELAKNDDRVEGDQSPFLIYRASSEQTITLKVLNYRSTAGGRFTLRSRIATAIDLTPGDGAVDAQVKWGQPTLLRIDAKKDRYYDLPTLRSISDKRNENSYSALTIQRVVGPSGMDGVDGQIVARQLSGSAIYSKVDGPLYFEVGTFQSEKVTWSLSEIRSTPISKEGVTKLATADNRLHVLEFPVKEGEIVFSKLPDFSSLPATWEYPSESGFVFEESGVTKSKNCITFFPNLARQNEVIQLFTTEGVVKLFLRKNYGPNEALVINTQKLAVWEPGKDINENLAIGESKFYLVKSTTSELMRVALQAKGFAPQLNIFNLKGESVNTMSSWSTLRLADDLYFPNAATFLVQIHCVGFGGSGTFELRRSTLAGPEYKLGTIATAKISSEQFGLFEAELKEGWYEIRFDRSAVQSVQVDVLDPAALFLGMTKLDINFGDRRFFLVRRSGKHRLWIRGPYGTYPFKIVPYVAPRLTDK